MAIRYAGGNRKIRLNGLSEYQQSGSTIKYAGSAAKRYMSSESHRTTTRTISIAMIMLISALAPMAVPVSATHNTSEPLVLEMQDDNGNWTGVPEFVDPITGNGDLRSRHIRIQVHIQRPHAE